MSASTRRPLCALCSSVSRRLSAAVAAFCLFAGFAGESALAQGKKFLTYSLEELTQVNISTVLRRERRLGQNAAAGYVLTAADIRRLGAENIPEALRFVPGLHVSQYDAGKWAVSSRGFNFRLADKMMVLIDGRAIYGNPYNGVFWEQNDIMIEDVERIEVVRGPGATEWGANAVNGIISVVTKRASDTQGGLVSVGAGNRERPRTSMRFGGKVRDDGHYRLFATQRRRGSMLRETGESAGDSFRNLRGGGRMDLRLSGKDDLSVQGELYRSRGDQLVRQNYPMWMSHPRLRDVLRTSGGFALAKWERQTSESSGMALEAFYSQEQRREAGGDIDFHTLDFDFQHQFQVGSRNDLLWGGGYRRMSDEVGGRMFSFVPARRSTNLYSAFLQDDIYLHGGDVLLTLGSKVQHNDYSGIEIQPSFRLLYAPTPRYGFWTAFSRAVRTPSRNSHDLLFEFEIPDLPIAAVGKVTGSKDYDSEKFRVYEAGARWLPEPRVSLELASFYTNFRGVPEFRMDEPLLEVEPIPRLVIPGQFINGQDGKTYGAELAADWRVAARWRLVGSYSWLRNIHHAPLLGRPEWVDKSTDPSHQARLRSGWDLSPKMDLDLIGYYVSSPPDPKVDAYLRLDAHFGWRLTDRVELDFVLRNILDNQHREFHDDDDYVESFEVPRSAFVRLIWRF